MRSWRRVAPAVLLLSLSLAACQQAGQSAVPSSQQVAQTFVSKVVVPRYTRLAEQSEQLAAALEALAAQPEAERLAAARRAWRQVRETWETSECWAFGPAQTDGFDSSLDDWPVNAKDLRTALAAGPVTPALFGRLTTTARGFHGIEAVLYGFDGQPPRADQLTIAHRTYLREAGRDLAVNAEGLLKAWQGPRGYGSAFAAAGDPDGDHAREAVAEILQGMVGTLEEVAAEKLGRPFDSRRKADFESFSSDNTRADVVANLSGVRVALERSGLLALIRGRDAGLATSVDQSIEQALKAARSLPPQLNTQLTSESGHRRIQQVITDSERSAALLRRAAVTLS